MLYSIIIDHIYHIDFVKLNKVNIFTNIMKFLRHGVITASQGLLLNNMNNNLLSDSIKKIILSSFGYTSSKDLKSLSDFSYYEEKLILEDYDIKSKSLFTGTSNIISIQGKILEIEEIYFLSNLSTDYNILS